MKKAEIYLPYENRQSVREVIGKRNMLIIINIKNKTKIYSRYVLTWEVKGYSQKRKKERGVFSWYNG